MDGTASPVALAAPKVGFVWLTLLNHCKPCPWPQWYVWERGHGFYSLSSCKEEGLFGSNYLEWISSKNGECNGTPLQYSCLENLMDGGAWKAAVLGVAEGQTRLSDFTFTFHCLALEKEVATHSSVLAWRIPGTGEPGGLLSMGSHRVGHD